MHSFASLVRLLVSFVRSLTHSLASNIQFQCGETIQKKNNKNCAKCLHSAAILSSHSLDDDLHNAKTLASVRH